MYINPVILRTACILVSSALALSPVAAQTKPDAAKAGVSSEPVSTTATYGSWVLRCVQGAAASGSDAEKTARAGRQTCEVVQTVQVQGQQQPIAQIALGRLPDDKELIVTALLPVNVSLPGNVYISGNGKTGAEEKGKFDLSWQRCFAGSCAASVKPDAGSLAILRAETEGQLRFLDATGNTIAIPLSWNGLDQALSALEKAK